jgi:hypothetical protein
MSRSRGLPSPTAVTPLTQVLDTLTDPGTPGTSDPSVTPANSVASDSRDTAVTPGSSDHRGVSDTAGTPGSSDHRGVSHTAGTRGTSEKPKPAARDHVKLRRDLAADMRDAVWFLSEHGRPRVQLGELLDEAVEAWLAEAKKTHNEGQDFPHRGRLR